MASAMYQWSKWATTKFFNLPMSICAKADPNSSFKRWGLTIFAFLMTVALIFVLRKTEDRLGQFSLCLVIAGAVGNAIDRLFFGAVTDMIDFSDIGFKYVFNVADSYITVGVIGLFISSYLNDRREKATAAASAVE